MLTMQIELLRELRKHVSEEFRMLKHELDAKLILAVLQQERQ